jgi:putative nucleotidyltransferase with HDIG domain
MKFDPTFLRSKVARRIFRLFVVFRSKVARRIFRLFVFCALFPIIIFAIVSFSKVAEQLNAQSQRRLHQVSKAAGLAIYDRLLFLEAEMKMLTKNLKAGTGETIQARSELLGDDLKGRFRGLAVVTDPGRVVPLVGRLQAPPEPTAAEQRHLSAGKTLVWSQPHPDSPSRIFLRRALDPSRPGRGILVGEVNRTYLWGLGDETTLPPTTDLYVLDRSNTLLVSSVPGPVRFPAHVMDELERSASGQFEWKEGEREYLAGYWSLPLQFIFLVPKWTVVLSESKADVLAPMEDFRKAFYVVIFLSLGGVLLLSINRIRQRMVPLERLSEGTRRIAARDFASRVTVASGDEFEELAASFNSMAGDLGRQFYTLATVAEIDRAILSALDTKAIATTVLIRMPDVVPCDGVCVTLLHPVTPGAARTYLRDGDREGEPLVESVALARRDAEELRANPEGLVIAAGNRVPGYLVPLAARGNRAFLVLPIFLKEKLSALIGLGYRDLPAQSQEDLVRARQVADQVAVALSNARLVEELDQLNWGTLQALARAIDAKSPWTGGHSERVTELAVKIGRVLGLNQKELDTLHRGGLLHDIGKIGTPPAVLDKPGKLTAEENRIMREHVRLGARILEPIPAYADVIPIVLHHHEWYDGTGYPDGLAGEAIRLGARIFAVADVYDALRSDRPYRPGLEQERVIELIRQGAGRQFDPKVVEAFLKVMAQEESASPGERSQFPSVLPV